MKSLKKEVFNQVWDKVEKRLHSCVMPEINNTVYLEVSDKVWEKIEDKVSNPVWCQVLDQIKNF